MTNEYCCPRGVRKVFGFPDIHWAVRDPQALAVATRAHALFRPDLTVFGGDLVDASPFARHPRRKYNEGDYDFISHELEPLRGWIDRVQDQTRGGRLAVLMGNHDDWLERWSIAAGIGHSLASLRPSVYLFGKRRSTQVVPFGRMAGNSPTFFMLTPTLIVVHGWVSNKYAAEAHLRMASPYSIVFHHTHRMEYLATTRCDGTVAVGMSPGCLTRKVPVYSHGGSPTGWVHGFWVAFLGKTSFTMYQVPIVEGVCVLPDGTSVKEPPPREPPHEAA